MSTQSTATSFGKVVFLTSPLFDNIDFPYVTKYRPKMSWFIEALKSTRTFEKYFGTKLEIVEVTELIKVENLDKYIREHYTKIHADTLYYSVRNQPYFKQLMHINLTLIQEAQKLASEGNIVVMPCVPPDLWAGKTFVRKCSIFSIAVYLAKTLGIRSAIFSLDVHYGLGVQDHIEYVEESEEKETAVEEIESEETVESEEGEEEVEEKSEEKEVAVQESVQPGLFYLSICSMNEVSTKIFRRVKKKPWSYLPVLVPPGVRDDVFIKVADFAARVIATYRPDTLIVQLGLDMYREDTIGEFMLSCDAYYDIGQLISFIPQAIPLKHLIVLIECVSARESIERAFPNFIAGLAGIEKPYYDSVSKESSQMIKDLTKESMTKLRRMLRKHWRVKVISRI